jgi:hypothetical protein
MALKSSCDFCVPAVACGRLSAAARVGAAVAGGDFDVAELGALSLMLTAAVLGFAGEATG